MSDTAITGSCQCGAVRYELTEPVSEVSHCHCSMCRKLHGALFVSFGTIRHEDMVIHGAEYLRDFNSSDEIQRQFCHKCGSQIRACSGDEPTEWSVCLGTLDPGCRPGHDPAQERHIFWESRVPWHDPQDGHPCVTGYGEN